MRSILTLTINFFLICLPWALRRKILCRFFGYELDTTSFIGLSFIMVDHLCLAPYARIGHFNIIRNLDRLDMGTHSRIGNMNWITGLNARAAKKHFTQDINRISELRMGAHAALTHRHIIDCTNSITIGDFSTIAGYRSQIITHGIDIDASRQSSAPVHIGAYTLIGSGCIILKGTQLPDRCLLGAGSVLTKSYTETDSLYAGTPARKMKNLSPDALYFHRKNGWVD